LKYEGIFLKTKQQKNEQNLLFMINYDDHITIMKM